MRELRKIKEPKELMRPMRLLGHIRLISLIGLIGLISCSNEDSVEPTPMPIDNTPIIFTALQQEAQTVTRGDNEDNGASAVTRSPLYDITSIFNVYGYKNMGYVDGSDPINYTDLQQVFPGYIVRWQENSTNTTVTNTNGWEYVNQQDTGNDEQSIKYWDWSATAYRFFGLARVSVSGVSQSVTMNAPEGSALATADNATLTMTVDATSTDAINATPYYSRLWFSNGNPDYPTRQFGKPVQLEFVKPYSMVRFMFVSTDPVIRLEDLHIEVISFAPTNTSRLIATAGTFNVTYPLTGTETKESWTISSLVSSTLEREGFTEDYNEAENRPHWYTVLPAHADDQGTYTLKITVNGEEITCVVPQEFMDWQPGFEYTYIFKVNDVGGVELGQVTSAYTDWLRGEEKEHPIYNW